jgi:ATP-dependent helicase/nuclease subunit B
MQEQILSALQQGETVITATRRLTRTLRQEFNTTQQTKGLRAWESPKILNWSDWMADLWQQLLYQSENPQTLLSSWQEQILWERVIRNSPESRELLQPHRTASVAQEAWLLANQWRLEISQVESLGNEDSHAFVGWANRFLSVCDSGGWLEQARLADVLRNSITRLQLPAGILLAGFDEFTPQQQDFLEASSKAGCSIGKLDVEMPKTNAGMVRIPFPDSEREIEAAARWARALLENKATGRIGVVVVGLSSRRNPVERIFRGILEPDAQLPGKSRSSKLINISAGNPFSAYPIIKSALAILSLSPGDNEWSVISNLIRSSYLLGADNERTNRALLDMRLRQKCGNRVKISSLLRMYQQGVPACPVLAQILKKWLDVCGKSSQEQKAGEWSRTFSTMLEAFGWPGERPLNSVEFQAMQAWTELLSNFASTDLTGESMTRGEAVLLVRRIAGNLMFQPETEQASVQILGSLEASGLFFDHLWIAGLHDEAWPGPCNPNPFLPIRLQREKGIPRCSPERELEFAVLITKRLFSSGTNVVLSHPVSTEDRELGASPLIAAIPSTEPGELNLWNGASVTEVIRNSRKAETIIDEMAPPLGETAWQRGGTKVFQYQSVCPFRAFAELRLGAEELESPVPGLDPRERGTLVHAVLEEVWKELKTHAALCSRQDLSGIIDNSVDMAITRLEQNRGSALPKSFAALERERLRQLITDWLEIEKNRQQPFEVISPEKEKYAEVSGIRFKVKIDRVDRLSNGREVIIDYKTGKTSYGSWETDRPDEPQLPLYSTIHEKPLAGILFARIKTGDMGFWGLVNNDLAMPKCQPVDLGAKINEWRSVLEKIGLDFRAGHAEVDPKKQAKQCRFCNLACLCRISELNAAIEEEEVAQ